MAYDAINTSMVKQYSANVQHLLQQRGSRLRGAVTLETGKVLMIEDGSHRKIMIGANS